MEKITTIKWIEGKEKEIIGMDVKHGRLKYSVRGGFDEISKFMKSFWVVDGWDTVTHGDIKWADMRSRRKEIVK